MTNPTNYSIPRGIRNNNPGNIEYRESKDPWQGLDNPPSDGRFCVFTSPVWGIRALTRVLLNYQTQHKLVSVSEMISRWAPQSENDTTSYITTVANAMGLDPDAQFSFADESNAKRMVKAVIWHENGQCPYTAATILQGVRRGLGKEPA